ncbi:hypothetical protein F5B18DRAFT_668511 [Nemania serpens]|nr:hypothetical protein F5B18DRAFT_668511 [Nemania serpens]
MMYLDVLIIFIAAAVVHAAVLPAVGDVCMATTVSGYSVRILSFFELFHSSFSTQLKATIFKRQQDIATKSSSSGDDVTLALIIFSMCLEFFIIIVAIWFGLYICVRRSLERRALQHNQERQRANQVLNSHPPQPGDIELVVLGARPQSEWPLPGQMATAQPDASHNSASENAPTRPDTPLPYITHYSSGKANSSEAGSPEEAANCQIFTETAIPEIRITDTETEQAHGAGTSNISTEEFHAGPSTSHRSYNPTIYIPQVKATETTLTEPSGQERSFFASATYEPETSANHHSRSSSSESCTNSESTSGETTIYNGDTTGVHAVNNIIVRDWAYQTL